MLDQASGAPTLASAVNIGAFNLGNALSAWLGGIVISAGLGYTAPNWVGAVLAASALVLALVSSTLERRSGPVGPAGSVTRVVAGSAPAEPTSPPERTAPADRTLQAEPTPVTGLAPEVSANR